MPAGASRHLEAGWSRHSTGSGCPGGEPGWSRQSWALAGATVHLSHMGLVHPFGTGCLCLGRSAIMLQWSVLCCEWHIWMSPLGGLGMPWPAWLWGQRLPGCSLPFPSRNRLGKHTPWECGARQEDANGQLVVFPAQALPTAPVPCSSTALGLSLRGEGVMQHDRQRRGSACATSLELPGW